VGPETARHAWRVVVRKQLGRAGMIALIEFAARLEHWTPPALKIGLARLIGLAFFWLNPRIRRNTVANSSVVLNLPPGDPKVRRLARRSVQAYAEHAVDFLRTFRLSADGLLRQTVKIEGYPFFEALHRLGRGGVLITAHFGNWEWCGGFVARGRPVYAVAETFPSRALTGLLDYVRARKNLRTLQVGRAASGVLRVLRQGEFVALLADRPTPGHGVQVQFFGRPVWVPEGAAALAQRAGSPLLVGGVIRRREGYEVHGFPAIFVADDKPRGEAVREAMQRVMNDVETLIRKAPEQWYMFRDMWGEPHASRSAHA